MPTYKADTGFPNRHEEFRYLLFDRQVGLDAHQRSKVNQHENTRLGRHKTDGRNKLLGSLPCVADEHTGTCGNHTNGQPTQMRGLAAVGSLSRTIRNIDRRS